MQVTCTKGAVINTFRLDFVRAPGLQMGSMGYGADVFACLQTSFAR